MLLQNASVPYLPLRPPCHVLIEADRRNHVVGPSLPWCLRDRIGGTEPGGSIKGIAIFTKRDMIDRVVAGTRDPKATPLAEVMTENPSTVSPEARALEALRLMEDGGYRHLPVVAGRRLVGIVSRRDFFGSEKAQIETESKLWERL